jgi:hypothetical protein
MSLRRKHVQRMRQLSSDCENIRAGGTGSNLKSFEELLTFLYLVFNLAPYFPYLPIYLPNLNGINLLQYLAIFLN